MAREYLPEVEATDLVTLAGFLRQLHTIPVPQDPPAGSGAADRQFLRGMQVDLVTRWKQARFKLAQAVVHGDAHNENLVRCGDGRIVFLDLERFGVGQPEWDMTLTAVHHECGWHSATDYAAFIDAYGYDVRASPAWPVLKAIRMLRMTTWLATVAGNDPARTEQVRLRLVTLRDGTAPVGWDGF